MRHGRRCNCRRVIASVDSSARFLTTRHRLLVRASTPPRRWPVAGTRRNASYRSRLAQRRLRKLWPRTLEPPTISSSRSTRNRERIGEAPPRQAQRGGLCEPAQASCRTGARAMPADQDTSLSFDRSRKRRLGKLGLCPYLFERASHTERDSFPVLAVSTWEPSEVEKSQPPVARV